MKAIDFIDIKENIEIKRLLDDPENYSIDAYACERLDAWMPDIGITNYPVRNIARSSAIIQSGADSTLRHRFLWSDSHIGDRYIGVLLYDSADEEFILELKLRDEYIGRIETKRHDNRRHLLVVPAAYEFIGTTDMLQITARGGRCILEKIVLLKEKPEPSVYIPRIKRLSVKYRSADSSEKNERKRAAGKKPLVDFVTDEPALSTVELFDEKRGRPAAREDSKKYKKLHSFVLCEIDDDGVYSVRVTAEEAGGGTDTAEIQLPCRKLNKDTQKPVTIPVELLKCGGAGSVSGPLTFGLPLPESEVISIDSCCLELNGRKIPGQTRAISRWPDGTVKWFLSDMDLPASSAVESAAKGRLHINTEQGFDTEGLAYEENNDQFLITGKKIRIVIYKNTKEKQFCIERITEDGAVSRRKSKHWDVLVTLADNSVLKSGPVKDCYIEESGRLRGVLYFSMPILDSQGLTHFESVFRVDIYYNQPYVRISCRFTVVSPVLAPAAGTSPGRNAGPAGKHFIHDEHTQAAVPSALLDAVDGHEEEQASIVDIKSVVLAAGIENIDAVYLNETKLENAADFRILQEHDLTYKIYSDGKEKKKSGRFEGGIVLDQQDDTAFMLIKDFWQTYPKGVSVEQGRLYMELLPAISSEVFPGDKDAQHRLYFWKKGPLYRLKAGLSLTTDMFYGFADDNSVAGAGEKIESIGTSYFVRPDIDWLNKTQVWSAICPKWKSPVPEYESWVSKAYDGWHENREELRQYGFMNFGDWYGEGGWSWGNNEYDPPFAHYMEVLRGGNPGWAVLAAQAARHLADIDTVNYSSAPGEIGGQYMHMPGHAGGYLPGYFKSKMPGSSLKAPHMWVEGPVLHYLLTGDRFFKESLDKIAEWVINGVDLTYYDFGNCRICGWHITHLCSLARMSDDPRFLNAASIIVERVLERQAPGGGWEHLLTQPHCGCYPPRHLGEAGFMVGVLLSALRKYFELSADQRVKEAIIGGARWLIKNTLVEETGNFRYTSCPQLVPQGSPRYVMFIIEGLSYALHLQYDETIEEIVRDTIATMGETFANLDLNDYGTSGYGKMVCMETRYIPIVLEYIKEFSEER